MLAEDPEADVSERPGAPRHPRAADRHGAQGPLGVPGAGPVGGRRPGGHPGAAPRRPEPSSGADDADDIWLVGFTNDAGPVPYYAYDRATRTGAVPVRAPAGAVPVRAGPDGAVPFTGAGRPDRARLPHVPAGRRAAGLPTVLNVHGGPWARDTWGFNPEAQWLANRGYLCVQVNFRGSTGYGKEFVNAGDREWGAKMQDDLSDAVAYVISQGWADPARVAIYGGSYGGYAALAGAAFTPGPVLLRGRHRRPVEPDHPDRVGPAVLGAADRPVPPAGRRPGEGRRLPVVPVAAVAGRRHPDPAADRPGRQRPAGEAGGVRADRGGPGARRASSTSTCCSPTRATASPSRRTGCVSTPRPTGSWPATWAAARRSS